MNSRLIVFTLMLPIIVCSSESPSHTIPYELPGSPTSVYSPPSSSFAPTPVTITINRSNSRKPLLPPEHATVPPAQKSLFRAYAMAAGTVVIFLTGFSFGKSTCNP